MSAEKLPPDGYELGPGWRDTGALPAPNVWKCMADVGDWRCCGLIAPYRNGGNGACRVHAEAMGAIVRKAEAPTTRDCGHGLRNCLTCAWSAGRPAEEHLAGTPEAPPEQPSGNAGRLEPRRNLLSELCRDLRESFRCVCDPETTDDEPCGCGGDGNDTAGGDGCWVCLANRYEEMAAEAPAAAPPEQPSRNPLQLPPEAPAAPVGETGEEACARLGIDVRQWAAEVRAKVAAAMPMPAAVVLEVVIKAMTVNFGQVYDGPSVCAENYGLVDRLRGIYKNPGGELRFAVSPIHKEAADRISALEAEVAARLVERDGWMEAAAKSESEKAALVSAAVQAERERCAATMDEWLANRLTLADCRQRVGDGTPIKNGDPAP